ncbi:hypothetical protein BOX15_Mlig016888g2 [Macrostomum lignano]|uniref:Membralin n=1 Tax=Macrostomum lignano TaxID=282301 RepID=A0A267FHX2_9PLAT|nr:hypothetical protein BOX15_Mlig016888g2 [Macrostomum lignano]
MTDSVAPSETTENALEAAAAAPQPPPTAQPPPPPPPPPPPAAAAAAAVVNNAERDQLFEFFLHRLCVIYASAFPSPARRFIEFVLLVVAVAALMILMYVHLIFVKAPVTCMDDLIATWPRNGVLRVEVIKGAPFGYDLNQSYHKEFSAAQLIQYHSPQQQQQQVSPASQASRAQASAHAATQQCNSPSLAELLAMYYSPVGSVYKQPNFRYPTGGNGIINNNSSSNNSDASSGDTFSYLFDYLVASANVNTDKALQPFRETLTELELFANLVFPREKHIIEYSLEYGFLKLSPVTRKNLNIPVQLVILDPNNHTCFGNGFSRFLLEEFLGYNDLLLAGLKRLAEAGDKGFVRNVVTGDQFRFVNVWMSRSSYLPSAFIMIIFTLCISMLLRYSHHQIFLFIADLLHRLEFNTTLRPPNLPVAQLLTIILGLVGMETIMSDFFTDSSTAFYVIIIIWISDQFLALLCHTSVTRRHWPRFFFLYHAGFYAYYYRFNGQYSGLALTTSWLFIQHSMIYLFHHFELPDILQRWSIRNAVDAIRQNDQQQQQQQQQQRQEQQQQ